SASIDDASLLRY
ncbi:hypothetical protein G6026_15300, partial [Dietzia sp. DQ11-38-2]|nr:hypothetical protein [Dietzia sp. DQ11-38-2]